MRYLLIGAIALTLFGATRMSGDASPAVQAVDSTWVFPSYVGHTGIWTLNHARNAIKADPAKFRRWVVDSTGGDYNASPHQVGSWYAALDSAAKYPCPNYNLITFSRGMKITLGGVAFYDLSCVRIAGQTAPGGGVTFTGPSQARVSFEGSDHVVIEYVRSRNAGQNMFNAHNASNIVYHRVSVCFPRTFGGGHLAINMSGIGTETALLNSLLCDPDQDHPTISRCVGSHWAMVRSNCSYVGNVIHGGGGTYRCPLVAGIDTVYVVNNIAHNCSGFFMTANSWVADFISNAHFVRPGQSTAVYTSKWRWEDSCADDDLGLPGPDDPSDCPRSTFHNGNRTPQNAWVAATPHDSMYIGSKQSIICVDVGQQANNDPACTFDGDTVPDHWIRTSALPDRWDIYPAPALDNTRRTALLDSAGVFRLLACDGTWRTSAVRDSIDQTRITWITNAIAQNGGPYGPATALNRDTLNATRAAPTPAQGTACTDSDNDGLPNAWEVRWTGDSADSTSINALADTDGDGWLNFEEYLNGTDPTTTTANNGDDAAPPGPKFWLRRDSLLYSIAEDDSVCTPYLTGGTHYVVVARQRTTSCAPGGESILKTWNDSINEGHTGTIYDKPLTDERLDSLCTEWGMGSTGCARIRARPAPAEPIGMGVRVRDLFRLLIARLEGVLA